MKRNLLSPLFSFTLFLLFLPALSGCAKPEAPVDETKHKDHDEAYRVEFTLHRGHLLNGLFLPLSPVLGAKHYDANEQQIIFENSPRGFGISPSSPDKQFVVMGGVTGDDARPADPATANWTDAGFDFAGVHIGQETYSLSIRFYAQDGDEISSEFLTPEESRLHQIFFIPENILPLPGADPSAGSAVDAAYPSDYNFLGYYYMDLFQGSNGKTAFAGISNPVGLDGMIEFYSAPTLFDLHVRLMHAKVSKYIDGNSRTSPFYRPSPEQLAREDWEDLDVKLPVAVFADGQEARLAASSFEELTESEKAAVTNLAAVYGISEREAFGDLLLAARSN